MAIPPLRIAFLWHMHQPDYRNPRTGIYRLPWVRLHGSKDYYDMAARLDFFPRVKVNFNLVPCLVEQIRDYAQGKAIDKHLELSRKSVSELTQDDKMWLIQHFFLGNWATMIEPYPRFQSLFEKCSDLEADYKIETTLRRFKDQDFIDLQVWSNLTWMGPIVSRDPMIAELHARQRNFTEEMKAELLDRQLAIVASIIPTYKKLSDTGRIEISTSPYFHPILPLLCDSDVAKVACPDISLPTHAIRFRDDAIAQITKAKEFHTQVFGSVPAGLWPPEAAVSNDVMQLASECGCKWLATDEAILAATLGEQVRDEDGNVVRPDLLYQPHSYESGGREVAVLFRDRFLSDLISFEYPGWPSRDAVDDFMARLEKIRKDLGNEAAKSLVLIALDGENCWEFYDKGGDLFLEELYTALSKSQTIETVRISDFLVDTPPRPKLRHIYPASWISTNLRTWIGQRTHNLAWDMLYDARSALKDASEKLSADAATSAWRSIHAAEGSDWFWWYGESHISREDPEFDALFRSHIRYVFESIGSHVPHKVLQPIMTARRSIAITLEPAAALEPELDGRVTTFYEWKLAGLYESYRDGTKGLASTSTIDAIYFGNDRANVYLRIDTTVSPCSREFTHLALNIEFEEPIHKVIKLRAQKPCTPADPKLEVTSKEPTEAEAVALEVIEMRIPLVDLKAGPDTLVALRISVEKQGKVIERRPIDDLITFSIPGPEQEAETWSTL